MGKFEVTCTTMPNSLKLRPDWNCSPAEDSPEGARELQGAEHADDERTFGIEIC